MDPLILVNAVGLTFGLHKYAPSLTSLAKNGWCRPIVPVVPAVTCAAQASILTGAMPAKHGVVANGWFWRNTGEVRFWQQSNRLMEAEPLYETARHRAQKLGRAFRCAKLFWWFNQGAAVDISVTPKPHYGADGNKVFAIHGQPEGLTERLEAKLGQFPFPCFWGPLAGLPSTAWIAQCAAEILRSERPDLTLVYLPHLDYDPQRYGRGGCDMPGLVSELDTAMEPVFDAARAIGARVWVVSEYGHVDVRRPVELNRVLRRAGLLTVRPGPFGEILDTFASRAFAVCDHQLAHVYVADVRDEAEVKEKIAAVPGVGEVLSGSERENLSLQHPRSGEIVVLAESDAWFAYPYWLDDNQAPDFARTVDIHRKPGFDPCELFFDPDLFWPRGRAALRLLQKKLGFRTLFDVIPLKPEIVRGSHGLMPSTDDDRPILIGDGPVPPNDLPMTAVHDLVLQALGLN